MPPDGLFEFHEAIVMPGGQFRPHGELILK
jgi:hypothetical protein